MSSSDKVADLNTHNLIEKETGTQVFSYEYYYLFKNLF